MNYAVPNISSDHVVQLCPPVSTYIEKSFEGILIYEIVVGFVNVLYGGKAEVSQDSHAPLHTLVNVLYSGRR